jgi:catechol 2,3-dioxygenase-like lactoylglutathione lyase family enzyme
LTSPAIVAFHTAVVVRDFEDAMRRYTLALGVDRWRRWQSFPEGSKRRMAYGRGNGMTFEIWGVDGTGDTQFDAFLREHGEGVQHIGFWTPDVRASVAAALEAGGRVVSGATDAEGNTAVQVTPGSLQSLRFAHPTFADAGTGFRLEYFGPGGDQMLRDWLQDDFGVMLTPPPWA